MRKHPDESFQTIVLDQLQILPGVCARRMFGGHGLYADSVFFGILYQGRLYFKTDDRTRPVYLDHGMSPFRPSETQTLKTYYEVPVSVLEDQETLCAWAKDAIAAQTATLRPPRRTKS